MLNVAVLVSGGGTNLQAIIDKYNNDELKNVCLKLVLSNKPNAFALERARKNNIEAICIDKEKGETIESYDNKLVNALEERDIDLVVLAGFLVILGKTFIDNYKNRIINVHPSLIPSFCGKGFYGLRPHEAALEYGVKVTGATVHFVELEADAGPIILQKAIDILNDDTPEILQKRVMENCEWELLPRAIELIASKRVSVRGRRVVIEKD